MESAIKHDKWPCNFLLSEVCRAVSGELSDVRYFGYCLASLVIYLYLTHNSYNQDE